MSHLPSTLPTAYDLLSRPVLELSDAEVQIIVEDLRKKRKLYIDQGVADDPKKAAAKRVKAASLTTEDRKANALSLLSKLNLNLPKA